MTKNIAIEFRNIEKNFGAVRSSRGLNFRVHEGHIHGIVGENGAGKSTAMKILFGLERPDAGHVLLGGRETAITSPIVAMNAGIGMVHQHFMLAEPLTALENLLLAEGGSPWDRLDHKTARARYAQLCERTGFHVNLDTRVSELPVGVQQRIEILKVLARDPRFLIFDEPTAVLTPIETREFFAQLRRLRDEGRTILIISHKLREIMEITDEVTVFRQGQVTGTRRTAETSAQELAELMIGRRLGEPKFVAVTAGPEVLAFEKFSAAGAVALHDLSLTVRGGEIVGIAGVEGNGQETLIRALAEPQTGKFSGVGRLLGHDLASRSTSSLRKLGAAFFPEDRLRTGMMETRPAFENFLLGHQNALEFRRGPLLNARDLHTVVAKAMDDFDVRPRDRHLPLGRFSGGNQQKFVVARELRNHPRFILAAHPTRGVDIGSVRFIHEKIVHEARSHGAAVLVVSSELEELMELCDRVHVLFRGRVNATFERAEFDEIRMGLAMGGKAEA